MDEVRPDRLGCYGGKRVKTPGIDRLASEGVLFEKCMAPSCLTPNCHAALLTALFQPHSGFRDPFCQIKSKTIAEIMKDHGYRTAGYVGISFLGRAQGFANGFDLYDMPEEQAEFWPERDYLQFGNLWQERCFQWIRDNSSQLFVIWGDFFESHVWTEHALLKQGLLKEGYLPELEYMDAKVELMDKILFQPLVELLDKLDLYDRTMIVAISDHGTNIGEHPAPLIPHLEITHPQHVFLYTEDLHVPLVIKSSKLPKGKRIEGLVRAVDVVPTILDLLDLQTPYSFDGQSLLPFVQTGQARGLVNYAEELWTERGPGDFQGLRSDQYNYIVDRRNDNTEEFYDLVNDPGEKMNLIDILDEDEQLVAKQMREQADLFYGAGETRSGLLKEEEEKIRSRLRDLHYIP